MFLFYVFSWLVEKYKNVTSMPMQFWSEISRTFLKYAYFFKSILSLKDNLATIFKKCKYSSKKSPSVYSYKREKRLKRYETNFKCSNIPARLSFNDKTIKKIIHSWNFFFFFSFTRITKSNNKLLKYKISISFLIASVCIGMKNAVLCNIWDMDISVIY